MMRRVRRVREWLEWHSIWAHIVGPIWLRIPDKRRWDIVYWLNRSRRTCWSDLVMDALAHPEDDACGVSVPTLQGDHATRCASVCDWSHPEHRGEHDCSCYCGKFQFTAADGATERAIERNRSWI